MTNWRRLIRILIQEFTLDPCYLEDQLEYLARKMAYVHGRNWRYLQSIYFEQIGLLYLQEPDNSHCCHRQNLDWFLQVPFLYKASLCLILLSLSQDQTHRHQRNHHCPQIAGQYHLLPCSEPYLDLHTRTNDSFWSLSSAACLLLPFHFLVYHMCVKYRLRDWYSPLQRKTAPLYRFGSFFILTSSHHKPVLHFNLYRDLVQHGSATLLS